MKDWRSDAACKGMGTALFFPPADGNSTKAKRQIAEALRVCDRCPVSDDCAAMAKSAGARGGVFGGRFIPDKNRGGLNRSEAKTL